MTNIFILTLLISFLLLIFLIVPIVMGIYVYRHALNHPIGHPMQWALICALTPLYFGLFLYIIKIDEIDTKRFDDGGKE